MLRDRLVCGIKDSRVQRRLLSETDLTFKKAFELAQASEVAEKNARDLHKPSMATESYITLTAHFITSEQKSYILATRNMPERHTGVHIEEHVLQLLSGWNLDKATFP